MDSHALNLLVEIIDSGNLSQAARKLKMTRANVSYHLAQLEKQTGVQRQMANEAFVNDVKAKQAALEDRWVAAAEGRGLKNARAVLSEFRAETQKLK